MDAADVDALANVLNALAQNPYDFALHVQHIALAAQSGQDEETDFARQMMIDCWAVADDVWLPVLDSKLSSVDLGTLDGTTQVLELFELAERDYLSIQILQKHLQFLVERYGHFLETRPEEFGEAFSVEWTRTAIQEVVSKGTVHLTQSHLLWDLRRDWELELLENATDKSSLIPHIESMFLERLQQPHSNNDETFQYYSTFTSTYKPPQEYESLLVSASKLRAPVVESYQRREPRETALAQAHFTPEAYAYYINGERRPKRFDVPAMVGLYERAIAEAAKRRFAGDQNAESALQSFWSGYADTLRIGEAEEESQLEMFRRALRSVPGSGEVWARYIRFLERTSEGDEAMDGREVISDAFNRALSTNLLQSDVEQIVPITLARAGVDKRQIDAGSTDGETFGSLVKVLEEGIIMVRTASRTGDPRFRLEKYLTEFYQKLDLPDSAIGIWQAATKHTKSSYLAWTTYADVLIKQEKYDEARTLFKDICNKKFDWPEAIWEAWISFEHLHGSVHDVEECLDKVEKAQGFLKSRRAKEAEQTAYANAQITIEQQAARVPIAEIAMDVDGEPPVAAQSGNKRKAEGEEAVTGDASSKRVKMEALPQPLKRDRENCTVFVSDLPKGTTPEELKALFKDCGVVRDIKMTQLSGALVATVEFSEKENVPAALTKDKKRIRDKEINVNMAWKSTLYVTNFPERTDDRAIKELFGKYGVLFDVRWPSKKYKSTRRFCYVQFIKPSAAAAALELNGRELDDGLPLNVYLSNPERKKERTDADANAKEVYVAGLSKFATKEDLETLFKTYGPVKEVRMTLDKAGKAKGFAFVEFELEKDAILALGANNYDLKNRRLAVTLADTRVKPKNQNIKSDTGLGRLAEVQSRSVRIRNLPPGTQEGLLQQTLEQYAAIKRLEVYEEINQATVELENAAEAGKLLLRTEPIIFDGVTLKIAEEEALAGSRKPGAPSTGAGGMFMPRKAAAPKPRAGLGSKKAGLRSSGPATSAPAVPDVASGSQRGQDDFRKMLGGK